MLTFLFIAAPTFVLGTLFGACMWWAFSQLLFDEVVNDHLKVMAAGKTPSIGVLAGQDRAHQGSGNTQLVRKAAGSLEL